MRTACLAKNYVRHRKNKKLRERVVTKRNIGLGLIAVVAALLLLSVSSPWRSNAEVAQMATKQTAVIEANDNGTATNKIAASFVAAISAPISSARTASLPEVTANKQLENDGKCDGNGCPCAEDISKLPITAPQGMVLFDMAACTRYRSDFYGVFKFKGEATIGGIVVYQKTEILGRDDIRFDADGAGEYSQFGSAISSLRIPDIPVAIKKFKLPPMSDSSNCWTADAVLKIKQLEVYSDDSDGAGNYPTNFEVLKIGTYFKCEAE
jgi:hypothetical protein